MTVPRIHIDGRDWVPFEAYQEAVAKLAEKQRTTADHNHQFAAINDMFENLPAHHAEAPYAASPEAFRKHALIATGHCDTVAMDMESHAAAIKAAPVIAGLAREARGYALVIVRGDVVVVSTPHSQSFKAMGKERFQQSKADCLRWAGELLGV